MSNAPIRVSGLRAVHAFHIASELSHLNGFDARQGVLSRTITFGKWTSVNNAGKEYTRIRD
jgi:hypothetical protein